MAAELHSSGWVLVAWILGGIITLFGALCNAEVAGLLAATGGEYVYYKKVYSQFFAFLFGWSLFAVIQTAAISSLAYIFAQSLHTIVPVPELFPSLSGLNIAGIFYPFQDFSVKLTAIAIIILLTWVNSKGVRTGAGLSNVVLILIFAGILLIICFGLTSKQAVISRSIEFSSGIKSRIGISNLFTAMLSAFWAYQGWATIGYIGGEVRDAKNTIPKGITFGVFLIIALYMLVNITYLAVLPVSYLMDIQASNKIAAIEAVRAFWGNNGALFMSVIILITTLGGTNATILVSARPYYAMATEGMFFRSIARVNRHHVPVNSLKAQCIWACLLVLSGSFDQLTDMIIFVVFFYYGATTLCVFILRKKYPDADRPFKVWGYPIVPAIVLVFCAVLLVNTFMARPREALFGLVLVGTGVPVYWKFRKKKMPISQ